MFSFFKRSKSRTPSNGEKLHNSTILDQDVTSCSKNTDHRLSNLNGNENKINFHENVNQFQNDTKRDRTFFTSFNEKNNIGGGTKNTVDEIPAVKKTSIFTEIMAKGRNRHRNKNKNNNYKNSNNNNSNNNNFNKNDQQYATLNIDHNNTSGINNSNNNNNNSDNNSNCILNNDTITQKRINDHIDDTEADDHHHHHQHHNRDDVAGDEKQNENFSSSNLFLNNKNDEYKNNLVEIEINNIISNNINFVKTTCSLPPPTLLPSTISTAISADVVAPADNPVATAITSIEQPAPSIEHNNDADFVKSLIINRFKMGQPSSKLTTTQPENISNNNNYNNYNNNSSDNNESNILDDQSDKEIFYEATDDDDVDSNNIVLNEKPVLPDLNQLIDIQINECEHIPKLDLICNNSDNNLIVNNCSSESDDISSSDNNSEIGNNNTIIESRILFDLRNELNEIKKHKVTNISSVQSNNNDSATDHNENNAFINNNNNNKVNDLNDDDNNTDNFSEKPKSIIKNKFDHSEKIKKRVTFLPDLVESTSIPPVHDLDDEGHIINLDDDDVDDNDDDDDEDEYIQNDDDNSIELSDNDDDEHAVDDEIKIKADEDDEDLGKNDYHVEFESSSSEEDLEKDINDLDDQNSLIIVEEINTSEEDSSIIEDNIIPRDLVNQESRFNEKLEKVENEKIAAQLKLEDLELKIDILEKEHSIKTWNVERLQAELISAYTEGECVRKRLKQHEQELTASRSRCTELEEEWSTKYDELQTKYEETQERLNEIKKFCSILQIQLAEAKTDLEKSQKEISDLTERHEQEQKLLEQVIDSAMHDKSDSEIKWKKEFEHLRSVNSEREEHLMEDCEWQLRNMQKICKDKVELAEKEKLETIKRAKEIELDAFDKYNQVEHFKSYEAEVNQLRGLTNGQTETIQTMNKQIDELNAELQAATERAETEIENMKKMKWQCEMEIYDNQRHTTQKIEMETMAIACQWEQKLLEEMAQLTNELNQIHGEERLEAVEEARTNGLKQLEEMKAKYDEIDTKRKNEIASLTKALQNKQTDLETLQSQADTQLVQVRMFLERAEHEHQTAIDREMEKREEMLNELREQHENEKQSLEEQFRERLQDVKDEFAVELTNTTTELTEKHKRNMQNLRQQLQKEKDEAIQAMEQKYKHKLMDLENKLKEQELSQQRIVDELKSAHKMERSILEQRDHQNNKEIETLHRKCRCLTNLFEEMRMRYERRDPRGEDLREIEELKNRCDQQENDLRSLTERLREYQLQNEQANQSVGRNKNTKNQPRKNSQPNIKVQSRSNIDVIYEEVEPDISTTNGPATPKVANIEQTVENIFAEQ